MIQRSDGHQTQCDAKKLGGLKVAAHNAVGGGRTEKASLGEGYLKLAFKNI